VRKKPICVDLFCGLGGWTEGFLAEGYECIGFDIDPSFAGVYPGEFQCADVRVLAAYVEERSRPSKWRDLIVAARVIVASPPCTEFSRHDQPWLRKLNPPPPDQSLWRAAERIAAITSVPLIIENVRGAQLFMGPAAAHFGKQYLWGEVPALLPRIDGRQNEGRQKQALPSTRRAERAKIPFVLSSWIAQVYKNHHR
jgi:hypothetical protein